LREERRLRVFENRVLKKISGPKRDEVTADWRKLHSGELHDLFFSPNIRAIKFKKNEVSGACGVCGGKKRCIQGFDGES
jgi:GH43 family beta-xylosidase